MLSTLLLVLSFATIAKSGHDYKLTYKSVQSFAATATSANGVTIEEISSVTESSTDDYFYGVTDNLIQNKPIYGFSVSVDENDDASVTFGDAIPMSDSDAANTDDMDTEGIAYITTVDGNDVVIITSEGYREFSVPTQFCLYELDGSTAKWIKDLSHPSLFTVETETGPMDGYGVESLSVDPSLRHLVYATEGPLLEDECDDCVRIVVSDLTIDGLDTSMDTHFMLRYVLDGSYDEWGLFDILVLNSRLDALLLEKGYNSDGDWSNRIYFANLRLSGETDITDCDILSDVADDSSDDCAMEGVDKTLLFDTADEDELAALGTDLVLESLGLSHSLEDDCNDLLFAVSDNENEKNTYFVFFELGCDDTKVSGKKSKASCQCNGRHKKKH